MSVESSCYPSLDDGTVKVVGKPLEPFTWFEGALGGVTRAHQFLSAR